LNHVAWRVTRKIKRRPEEKMSETTPYPMETYRIADETYVLPHVLPLGPDGNTYLNTMVIRGKEPVVVDTSGAMLRETYLKQLGEVVDLDDIRWIYLSHDDGDHTGNVLQVLEAAPKATLIMTSFMLERMGLDIEIPVERTRWVNDGEGFTVDGRTLYAIRPPIFDSPVTRGLFDPRTGVFWGGDSFGFVSPTPVYDAADVPEEAYGPGFLAIASLVSPWHGLLDETRYARHIKRVADLPITTIVSGHGAVTRGPMIAKAFELLREVPRMDEFPQLTQRDLEAMLAETSLAVAA
jgi:flavorubredoxin